MNKETEKIVITGAPGSGKTKLINRLKDIEQFKSFVFLDEIARELLKSRPEYRHNWIEFHKEIYTRHVERESELTNRPFITDRGTLDAFAFCSTSMNEVNTTVEREYNRYTMVLLLGSAASLGASYYVTDDERLESVEEALEIEDRLKNIWSGHPNFHFIQAYKEVETKYSRSIAIIERVMQTNDQNSTNCENPRL